MFKGSCIVLISFSIIVQGDATKLAREKHDLQREVDDLRRRLDTAERASQSFERSGKGNQDNSITKIRELEDELDAEKRNNNARISETPQFVQMRKMMQSQNKKIRDLRYFLKPQQTKLIHDLDFFMF